MKTNKRSIQFTVLTLFPDLIQNYLGDALFVKSEHQRLNEPDKAPLLSAETYLKAAREFVQRNLDPGELASIALRKYVREPMVV